MDTFITILGIIFSALGIVATYHISVRQGIFTKDDVLLTLSLATLWKKGDSLPKYVKPFKIGNLTPPNSFYPFLLKMPFLVTFGVSNSKTQRIIYLPITLVNKKRTSISNISLHIFMPVKWMPDQYFVGTPKNVQRVINATKGEGHIEYTINLKPFDCHTFSEPILVNTEDIIEDSEKTENSTQFITERSSVKCIIQTSKTIHEELLWLVVLCSQDMDSLIRRSLSIGINLMNKNTKMFRKPFLKRFLFIPYAHRAIMCVQPNFFFPSNEIAVHSYGKFGDKSKTEIIGVFN